ncbi:MAG: hypothetical protein PHX08_07805 [Lachnospiraceae bacterium]|nr:hypothetical protein [Lachnospiraceae bacterium]
MQTEDYLMDLNDYNLVGIIECPYCTKGKSYSYGATGKQSSPCKVCGRIVLWDYDLMKGFKARAKKYAS